MKLADLRKLSVRRQVKIHFRLRDGMECVVNEQGVAQVPSLRSKPEFNLEEELAGASEFLFEPAPGSPEGLTARKLRRDELQSMVATRGSQGAAHDQEHEEE